MASFDDMLRDLDDATIQLPVSASSLSTVTRSHSHSNSLSHQQQPNHLQHGHQHHHHQHQQQQQHQGNHQGNHRHSASLPANIPNLQRQPSHSASVHSTTSSSARSPMPSSNSNTFTTTSSSNRIPSPIIHHAPPDMSFQRSSSSLNASTSYSPRDSAADLNSTSQNQPNNHHLHQHHQQTNSYVNSHYGGTSNNSSRRPSRAGITSPKASESIDALLKDLEASASGLALNANSDSRGRMRSDNKPSNSYRSSSEAHRDTRSQSRSRGGNQMSSSSNNMINRSQTPPTAALSSSSSLGREAVRPNQERREAERIQRELEEAERLERERRIQELKEAEEKVKRDEVRRGVLMAEEARRARERRQGERRELERMEAEEMEAEMQRRLRSGQVEVGGGGVDVIPDYLKSLIRTLRSDTTLSPTPEDFLSTDGFDIWQRSVGDSLQNILADLVKYRFLDRHQNPNPHLNNSSNGGPQGKNNMDVGVYFKVVKAENLIAKEGKSRDPYCKIEFGPSRAFSNSSSSSSSSSSSHQQPQLELFMTEVIPGTTSPLWNQHLNLQVRNPSDAIRVSVWDRRKDDFLGQVKLSMGDLIDRASREGYLSGWYTLGPREGKSKDKYVGGSVLIEFTVTSNSYVTPSDIERDPIGFLETNMLACRVNFKSLYKALLRNCLTLDMFANPAFQTTSSPTTQPIHPDDHFDLLSDESKTVLNTCARKWLITPPYQVLAFFDLLFQKCSIVPVRALLDAYETIYTSLKADRDWLSAYEKLVLTDLLEDVYGYYKVQVGNYKDAYPKNRPEEGLENTVLLLRMVSKNELFRAVHPELGKSFRAEIKAIMSQACTTRYKRLHELTLPFDETDLEAVIEGLTKLADLLTEDLTLDVKYFKTPFEMELDIVKLTSETYITLFASTMEIHALETIPSDAAVKTAGKGVFELYKRLKAMETRWEKMVPGLRKSEVYSGRFHVERWFGTFVGKWLDHLGTRTVEWVESAVKADNFAPVGEPGDDGIPAPSSSVIDLFKPVYTELDLLVDLGWGNAVQSAGFFQKFAKTVNRAIEQYCDVIGVGEIKPDPNATSTSASWTNLLQSKPTTASGPANITNESCVKLCNTEYALNKLDEMYSLMNVSSLTRTVQDWRATMAPLKSPQGSGKIMSSASSPVGVGGDGEDVSTVKGAFRIQIAYAENLKPVTKSGSASPFIVIRVPEGTVVPPPDPENDPSMATLEEGGGGGTVHPSLRVRRPSIPGTAALLNAMVTAGGAAAAAVVSPPLQSLVLTGGLCELARTRSVPETLNPTWDETFTSLLPPVSALEIEVYSKNLLTADEFVGKAVIDLNGRTSRLRRKLKDHHTHDVFIELEPQGRVLIRLTMEGEEEDVDFWFRRSRERLGRTRDDFLRGLAGKISPYIREVVTKAIKEHEAAPLQSRNFLLSLTSTIQYSNQTQSGIAIDQPVTSDEAYQLLRPLTDYLDRNLETICQAISPEMAQEVVKRTWDETLLIVEQAVVPPLFGQIESARRVLNKRQITMAEWVLKILKDFFHADGEALGLPIRVLESRRYADLTALMSGPFFSDLGRLKREYELSLLQGKEKELYLRVVRLRYEKQDDLAAAERDEGRKWIELQLVKRKERRY
ncbi:hypothetical protein HDV05_004660 [Chytridiales sp. JEL 0842]|nr:hypothetical protein HDV05_004660 [Chytridiales sp. JEL 0842]